MQSHSYHTHVILILILISYAYTILCTTGFKVALSLTLRQETGGKGRKKWEDFIRKGLPPARSTPAPPRPAVTPPAAARTARVPSSSPRSKASQIMLSASYHAE
jgi:hypothetical protein